MGRNSDKGLRGKKLGLNVWLCLFFQTNFSVLVYVGCQELEQLECKIL